MESLIYLAAAIPFVIIFLALTLLATVRYSITEAHLKVTVIGIAVRNLPLSEITGVEYVPEEEVRHWSLFHRGGMVIVRAGEGKSVVISPRDAETFSRNLKAEVFRRTGRRM